MQNPDPNEIPYVPFGPHEMGSRNIYRVAEYLNIAAQFLHNEKQSFARVRTRVALQSAVVFMCTPGPNSRLRVAMDNENNVVIVAEGEGPETSLLNRLLQIPYVQSSTKYSLQERAKRKHHVPRLSLRGSQKQNPTFQYKIPIANGSYTSSKGFLEPFGKMPSGETPTSATQMAKHTRFWNFVQSVSDQMMLDPPVDYSVSLRALNGNP